MVADGRVSETGHAPTATLGQDGALPQPVREGVSRCGGVAFCSVVPAAGKRLEAALRDSRVPVFHLTHRSCRGLDLVYPNPSEIGEDRIANAMAAREYHGVPAVVIDMGTAVTFDILSSRGYEGGIIAPGLRVMTHYLHEQTALLPELAEEDLVGVEGAIGKSTVHAMKLGVAVGFSGMIDALLARVTGELAARGEPAPVVLSTGGDIANLTRDWAGKSRFVENLTLAGLEVAFRRAKD